MIIYSSGYHISRVQVKENDQRWKHTELECTGSRSIASGREFTGFRNIEIGAVHYVGQAVHEPKQVSVAVENVEFQRLGQNTTARTVGYEIEIFGHLPVVHLHNFASRVEKARTSLRDGGQHVTQGSEA